MEEVVVFLLFDVVAFVYFCLGKLMMDKKRDIKIEAERRAELIKHKKKLEEEKGKTCPLCLKQLAHDAKRCSYCWSKVN